VQADQVLARLWPSVIVCGRVRARVPSAISAGRSGLGLRGHTGLRQRVENNVHRIEGTALGPLACIADRSSLVSWLAVVLLSVVLEVALELVSESDAAAAR